jgi:hypothetical protein
VAITVSTNSVTCNDGPTRSPVPLTGDDGEERKDGG